MAYSKVEADGRTLIDLTSDTVTADTLVSGRTAHLASGAQVTGTFEPVTGVKGNAESTYRKGNVNLTPENIGAATTTQGEKADSAVQTIQIGGTTQTKTNGTVNIPAYPTKSSLGLSNVDNTSDANKPVSTAAQAALDSQQAQIDYNSNQGVKNLVKITADTQTMSGVTFTVDKVARTITVNGTATANVWFEPIKDTKHFYPANVRLTGCPSGGSNKSYYLGLTGADGAIPYRDYGNGCDIPVAHIKRVAIGIVAGYTCNNLVFKPMIRDASIKDDTFQPYAMSNVELTQKALIKEDDNAGGYVVDLDKDCKLQRNANYIYLRNNSINIHTDSSNISLQCGTTGSPLRGVQITNTAVRMYFGLNTLTVDESGLWFNNTKIAE